MSCPNLILPCIIYPSTVKALQARLSAAVTGTDGSVRACAAIDSAGRAAWGQFYVVALDFAAKDPGIAGLGAMMDQGESYELDLVEWQKRIQAASCKLSVPIYTPTGTESPNQGKDRLLQAIQYVAIAAVAVATAYGVAKVAELIPSAKQRYRERASTRRLESRKAAPQLQAAT